jgi:hypothetical protein
MEFVHRNEDFDVLYSHQDNSSHLGFDLELVSPGSFRLAETQVEPVRDISLMPSVAMDLHSWDPVPEVGTDENSLRCVVHTCVFFTNLPRDEASPRGESIMIEMQGIETEVAVPRTYHSKPGFPANTTQDERGRKIQTVHSNLGRMHTDEKVARSASTVENIIRR